MELNNNNNDNDNDNDTIRPPDDVFCEKLIDDNDDIFHFNPPPYKVLPTLKRHITNTWHIQKTDDNRFISVPLFKDENDSEDESEDVSKDVSENVSENVSEDDSEDDSEDVTWLYDSILNNSDNNDNITIDDYDLEKAIQESLNQYNLENKNTLLPLIDSNEEHNEKEQESEFEHQTQITEIDLKKKNLLPIFKSKIQRLIYFDKEFKEIYELIKPIIDLYETSDLNYHESDDVTYDKIFNTLLSLRIPKEEWNILKTIFVKEVN